jgi:hypothetical protein
VLTIPSYVLPDHPSSVTNDAAAGHVKGDASSSPLRPDEMRAAEATVRFWNEEFFKPRGVQIRSVDPVPAGPQDGSSSTSAPRREWGFAGIGVHSQGVRIGPIHADNEGFRLGRNALVADSKGFRLGQNGVVADSNGFRVGQNGMVADSNGFRLGNVLAANRDGFRLGGFRAHSQGVSLGGWGIGQREVPAENGGPSGSQDYPREKGKAPENQGVKYEGEGSVLDRGRSESHSKHSKQRDRSSSTSSSSSSSSSDSDSSEEAPATRGDLSGMKKDLKDLKRAHKKAKKQAKKERRAAKRAAKRERRREKREGKRALKAIRSSHAIPPYHPHPSTHPAGLVTGLTRAAPPTPPPAYPLDHKRGPTSREADHLRLQARDLEHEALVKETVANGIRAAATGAGVGEEERAGRLSEASAGYEEAEALRREVERLRAEAAHLDREFAGGHAMG